MSLERGDPLELLEPAAAETLGAKLFPVNLLRLGLLS